MRRLRPRSMLRHQSPVDHLGFGNAVLDEHSLPSEYRQKKLVEPFFVVFPGRGLNCEVVPSSRISLGYF